MFDQQNELKLPKLNPGEPKITLAPLVDIVFLLLIFFVIATVFPENQGIQIDKPSSNSQTSIKQKKLVLTVDESDRVYYQNKQVQRNDITHLVRTFILSEPKGVIFLQVDRNVTTQNLVWIMDFCKAGGAQHIALAVNPKDGKP